MVKESITVTGMMCAHCEHAVSAALSSLPGVRKVKASHKKGRVDIQYDEGLCSRAAIDTAIAETGYEVA